MLLQNEMHFLAPDTFLTMLKSGAKRVIAKEFLLNQLNVFPIPDKDTGSNMAAMMRYFLAQQYTCGNFQDLFKQIADALLAGACGNSGMIFSAFFMGLASVESEISNNALSIQEFVQHLRKGVICAHQAVAIPTEGTMLSVMSAWVSACEKIIENSTELTHLLKRSIPIAEQALKQTRYQLAALERNKIVDAGALGFFEFIVGMNEALHTEDDTSHHYFNSVTDEHFTLTHTEHFEEAPIYQYCAETLLSTTENASTAIKSELENLGDSLVINRSANNLKIHLHTNDALTMTNRLKKYGSIDYQKIDSTKAQWEAVHAKKYSIALVTDSSADIPAEWIDREQIQVFPLKIRLGSHNLLDRLTITLTDLYQKIHHDNLSANSAAPSAENIMRQLNALTQHYDSVIVITISSHLSSTYQTIASVAAKISNKRITVIDSRTTSAALGLLLMRASQWIQQALDHDTVVKNIENMIPNTHFYVAVNELKTVVKSGRAPEALGLLAAWGRIKPIISISALGKPISSGITIGKQMCWNKIAKLVKKIKKLKGIHSIGIVHSANPQLAKEFADFIAAKINAKINFILETSCVLGLHAGKDCVAIAVSNESID